VPSERAVSSQGSSTEDRNRVRTSPAVSGADRHPTTTAGTRDILEAQAQVGNRMTVALLRNDHRPADSRTAAPTLWTLRRRIPMAVQRLGINDRQWDEVTSVHHLGATAYELRARTEGEAVVVKTSGKGRPGTRSGRKDLSRRRWLRTWGRSEAWGSPRPRR
jgi:hypothetical protein